MAARNAPYREPCAAHRSVFLERADRISRTTRIITARRREQWRDAHLIQSHEQYQDGFHARVPRTALVTASISAANEANVSPYAAGVTRITRSTAGSSANVASSRRRTNSRSRRLRRLRSTAVCLYLGTMKPTRGCDRAEARTLASRFEPGGGSRTRFPVRRTAASSALLVSRYARGNASRACVLGGQLHGQPLAPFFATTTQSFTPPPGRHARAKPVRLDPTLISGTISWLTHC